MTHPTPTVQRPTVPWLEVLAAASIAALHAVVLLGRIHPDEVFQSLEPALHRAFGYGILAWEWQVGLRNWVFPGLLALLLKASSLLGIDDVMGRRIVLEIPNYFLHAAMLAAVWRFSLRRVGPLGARFCLWLIALYSPVVWFAGRTMSESISTALLVWGLERIDSDESVASFWGGALLGFAEVARYGSAAIIAPALIVLLFRRQWRTFALVVTGGAVVALALGAFDKYTWGTWFHSLSAYVDFNVVSGKAARQFGSNPWHMYLPLLSMVAPFSVVGLWKQIWHGDRRSTLFIVSAVIYIAAISLTPHKEARFLYPALVLLAVAAVPSFVEWATTPKLRWVAALIVALGAIPFFVKTAFDVERKAQFQLTVRASRGATGFILMNEGLWGSGGYFYLGKNIPWCRCDFATEPCLQSAANDRRFNRAIYWIDRGNDKRNAESIAAFERLGFKEVERRSDGVYFERS